MPTIVQMPAHLADLIAAGEVVERPGAVVKELVENAIDAHARQITIEIQNGGMRLIRVTDDGCGMDRQDAQTAFLRHATSKLRQESDLAAIGTLGFRGEALAAISAVSRISLLTRTADAQEGTALQLEAGTVTSCEPAGCPKGTTIVVRELFYNTPARYKFMKSDLAESSFVTATVQRLAIAHPEIAFRLLKDGQQTLHTAGDGRLQSAVYQIFGRQTAMQMVPLESRYEAFSLTGLISLPTASRGSRAGQMFFVNGRYIRSKTMTAALEEAYKNQIMVGRFPACVLNLQMPLGKVDVNVHPAKTEVRFLSERAVFDCVYYGVRAALARAPGKKDVTFSASRAVTQTEDTTPFVAEDTAHTAAAPAQTPQNPPSLAGFEAGHPPLTTSARAFSASMPERTDAAQLRSPILRPQGIRPQSAADSARAPVLRPSTAPQPEWVQTPQAEPAGDRPLRPVAPPFEMPNAGPAPAAQAWQTTGGGAGTEPPHLPAQPAALPGFETKSALHDALPACAPASPPAESFKNTEAAPAAQFPPSARDSAGGAPLSAQTQLSLPQQPPAPSAPEQAELPLQGAPGYRVIGEALNTYILVEEPGALLLIDKHAAHERILFEKLKRQDCRAMSQQLLQPYAAPMSREEAAVLLERRALLEECGFALEDFGDQTVLIRAIPDDLDETQAGVTLGALAADLLQGKRLDPDALRDELLHTIACKAAIKGGWHTEPAERDALVREVLTRDDLKYCPHGRPICLRMTEGTLQRQFKRS